jgi:DtxR family transcriptional regulator, Mn-dependent transcriptional regulator
VNALTATDALTRSVEDYLKAIYRLSTGDHPAATSDIANHLDLSAPSVSGMMKRLSEQGLVEHVPYKGVVLTAEGRRQALRMVRRHRMIEAYLVRFLGYDWDTVHDEAERLEHAVSDTMVDRMAEALDNPTVDPHGDPIPATDGSFAEPETVPLASVAAGELVEIVRVQTGDPEQLRYLASIGLRPGVRATVIDRQPFDGPLTVAAGEARQVLGHEMASRLLCAVVEAP